MSDPLAAIEAQLPERPSEEQAELDEFIRSLDPPGLVVDDEAFERELRRRVEELANKKAIAIPAEEVISKLRDRYSAGEPKAGGNG
jgi:hypothetical protein